MTSNSTTSNIRGYQHAGRFAMPAVRAKHARNLARVLDDLALWEVDMVEEFSARRFCGGKYVRWHDAGDWFSDDYLSAALRIARAVPDVLTYCYTKEVSRFRRLVEPDPPENFRWVYSYGGREDHLLDPTRDRVADVFPDEASITAAGHHSNARSDLLAVLGPAPVGMRANNIPHLRHQQGGMSFRQWQQAKDRRHRTTATPNTT